MTPIRSRVRTRAVVVGAVVAAALLAGTVAFAAAWFGWFGWFTDDDGEDYGPSVTSIVELDALGSSGWPGGAAGVFAHRDGSRLVASTVDGEKAWQWTNGAAIDALVPLSADLAWVATSGNPASDGSVVDRHGVQRWAAPTSGTHLAAVTPDVVVRMDCRTDSGCTWTGHAAADGSTLWEVQAEQPVEASAALDPVGEHGTWADVVAVADHRGVPALFATTDSAPQASASGQVQVHSAATGAVLRTIADETFVIAGGALVLVEQTAEDECAVSVAGEFDVGPVETSCELLGMDPARAARTGDTLYAYVPAGDANALLDLTTGESSVRAGSVGLATDSAQGLSGERPTGILGAGMLVDTVAPPGAGYPVRDARTSEHVWGVESSDEDPPRVMAAGNLVVIEHPLERTLREKLSRNAPPQSPVRLEVYRAEDGDLLSSTRLEHSFLTGAG